MAPCGIGSYKYLSDEKIKITQFCPLTCLVEIGSKFSYISLEKKGTTPVDRQQIHHVQITRVFIPWTYKTLQVFSLIRCDQPTLGSPWPIPAGVRPAGGVAAGLRPKPARATEGGGGGGGGGIPAEVVARGGGERGRRRCRTSSCGEEAA